MLIPAQTREGDDVAAERPERAGQGDEEESEEGGGDGADAGEAHQLAGQAGRELGIGEGTGGQAALAGGEAAQHPPDPLQVVPGGAGHVDPGVGVVDPVDGHLVDAQPVVLGQHEQFGVEEPAVVLDEREQGTGDVGPQRLEAALGVTEPVAQGGLEDEVVAAGDQLAAGAAHHPGARRQPGPDGDVGMSRQEGGDQGEEGVEVGGQVDIHVGDTGEGLVDHAARSARPRPFWSRWMARTPSSWLASRQAMPHVWSRLALSAMVMVQVSGNRSAR